METRQAASTAPTEEGSQTAVLSRETCPSGKPRGQAGGVSALKKGWAGLTGRVAIMGTLLRFLWQQRLWWMIPMVIVLLGFGVLLILAQQTVIAPFIYTLF